MIYRDVAGPAGPAGPDGRLGLRQERNIAGPAGQLGSVPGMYRILLSHNVASIGDIMAGRPVGSGRPAT